MWLVWWPPQPHRTPYPVSLTLCGPVKTNIIEQGKNWDTHSEMQHKSENIKSQHYSVLLPSVLKAVMILIFLLAGVTLKRLVKSSNLGNSSRFVYRFCRAFRHFRRTSPCWKRESETVKNISKESRSWWAKGLPFCLWKYHQTKISRKHQPSLEEMWEKTTTKQWGVDISVCAYPIV